jgi:hypothetical protein
MGEALAGSSRLPIKRLPVKSKNYPHAGKKGFFTLHNSSVTGIRAIDTVSFGFSASAFASPVIHLV